MAPSEVKSRLYEASNLAPLWQACKWYGFSWERGVTEKSFVALNDPIHAVLRDCTRHSPLRAWGRCNAIRYEIRPEALSNSYYSLAAFHALQGFTADVTSLSRWRVDELHKPGIPYTAGYFDATRLDRRCGGDLRLQLRGSGPRLVAAELLVFGTGTLRAAGYAPAHCWEYSEYGRLSSALEVEYCRITALCCGPGSSAEGIEKEIYCSSNVIYGDVLGEIEQLWERRADTEFLAQVADDLQQVRGWQDWPAPAEAPLNYTQAIKLHLRSQALWRRPPQTARGLLRRLERILGSTIIDNAPRNAFNRPDRRGLSGPGGDRTGYDGWLMDGGAALN